MRFRTRTAARSGSARDRSEAPRGFDCKRVVISLQKEEVLPIVGWDAHHNRALRQVLHDVFHMEFVPEKLEMENLRDCAKSVEHKHQSHDINGVNNTFAINHD